MLISEATAQYLEYLEHIKHASPRTVSNYRRYLKRFSEFSDTKIAELTIFDIDRYRIYLSTTGLSLNSQNYHVVAVRCLLKYCLDRDMAVLNPSKIELTKLRRPKPQYLKANEISRILDVYSGDSVKELRNNAVIHLLYSSGIRVGELTSLNRDDIDFESCSFYVMGKGSKPRYCMMSIETGKVLKRYLSTRLDDFPSLFVSQRGHNGLSSVTIQTIVKKAAIRAGIQKTVTPHTLRHTLATTLLNNGANMRMVQEVLGHSSILTTQRYTHISKPNIRVYEKFLTGRLQNGSTEVGSDVQPNMGRFAKGSPLDYSLKHTL